jgi:hypothetical protein
LNAPHFYHEIVKRAVTAVLDKPLDSQIAMSKLLLHLFTIGMPSPVVVNFIF